MRCRAPMGLTKLENIVTTVMMSQSGNIAFHPDFYNHWQVIESVRPHAHLPSFSPDAEQQQQVVAATDTFSFRYTKGSWAKAIGFILLRVLPVFLGAMLISYFGSPPKKKW